MVQMHIFQMGDIEDVIQEPSRPVYTQATRNKTTLENISNKKMRC